MSTEQEGKFTLKAIGRVCVQEGRGYYGLEIDPPYRQGLQGLDQFSHVIVFWWADRMDSEVWRKKIATELPYAPGVAAGVFACRSEYRPNPIAITTLPILGIDPEAGAVTLPWIDAFDGTPVIDLKPYTPVSDRIRDARPAPWMADWPLWMEEAGDYFAEHATDFGD